MHTSLLERCNHNKKESAGKCFFPQYMPISVAVRHMNFLCEFTKLNNLGKVMFRALRGMGISQCFYTLEIILFFPNNRADGLDPLTSGSLRRN